MSENCPNLIFLVSRLVISPRKAISLVFLFIKVLALNVETQM